MSRKLLQEVVNNWTNCVGYDQWKHTIEEIAIELTKHKQEPVDGVLLSDCIDNGSGYAFSSDCIQPLYKSPQQLPHLTDDEILKMANGNNYPGSNKKIIEFARAIEKKLRGDL